jgi:AhpD family alkylhydroperoxidase
MSQNKELFPPATHETEQKKADLAPESMDAWRNFSKTVFKDGALDEKTKQLIAVAVAHATQCPYCIQAHTKIAKRKGANNNELMEAIWVSAEMKAGAAYAHSTIAIQEMENLE